MPLEGTWTKLKDGSWGGRIVGQPEEGDVVIVRKRDGKEEEKQVARIVWTDGQVSLVAFGAPAARRAAPAAPPPAAYRHEDDGDEDAGRYARMSDDVLMALYAASWEGE
jgi:hypothetical protein